MAVFDKIAEKIKQLEAGFDEIPSERRELLEKLAGYIQSKIEKTREADLIFICTHNSRRSHISQIWALAAANHYGVKGVRSFSGGTEATAFNQRAVRAVEKAGFRIDKKDDTDNPVYLVYYSGEAEPVECFSKVYTHEFNPKKGYAAVMNCSDADENCPVVFGSEIRLPIRYEDPKKYDGTDLEEAKYDERINQIGREALYVMKLAAEQGGRLKRRP